MRWSDFLRRKSEYQEIWNKLKSEYSSDIRKFLDRSYLVIFYNFKQVSFDIDVFSIARENPDFFIRDEQSLAFIKLADAYKLAEKQTIRDNKDKLLKQIARFDIKKLNVVRNRPEARFPSVNMPFIQEIKKSQYCDQEATDMSMASIRVILKGGDAL